MTNFREFLDYCMSFYNPYNGLYPIDGLTREELALATLNYLDVCESAGDNYPNWGGGDTLDRERVREFVISRRSVL